MVSSTYRPEAESRDTRGAGGYMYICLLHEFDPLRYDTSGYNGPITSGSPMWQKIVELGRDSNHGSLVIRTTALPTELPSLHNSVIQILGFLLTTPASMVSSTYRPEAESRVAGVRAGTCIMFATDL